MERILEPELMDDAEQALAYTLADFSQSHGRRVEIFREAFPGKQLSGAVLDLGCGSGDVLFRFARAFPAASFLGVDGARHMLELAREGIEREPALANVEVLEAILPTSAIPPQPFELVMSHSLLHHLHQPDILWRTIAAHSQPGTLIFVADLQRPESLEVAQRTIDELAPNEPPILRRDFFNSLCAAFTPDEIAEQLRQSGLSALKVSPVSPTHLIVYGVR